MIILVSKNNTDSFKKFLIPKNDSYNCLNWVEIIIDNSKKEFTARKVGGEYSLSIEWEEKINSTFPSSLFTEFLRSDFIDKE